MNPVFTADCSSGGPERRPDRNPPAVPPEDCPGGPCPVPLPEIVCPKKLPYMPQKTPDTRYTRTTSPDASLPCLIQWKGEPQTSKVSDLRDVSAASTQQQYQRKM